MSFCFCYVPLILYLFSSKCYNLFCFIYSRKKVPCTYLLFFIHLSLNGSQGWLSVLAIVSSATIGMDEQVSLQCLTLPYGYVQRSSLTRYYCKYIFLLLKNLQTNFNSGLTILLSDQQWAMFVLSYVLVSIYHLVFIFFLFLICFGFLRLSFSV